MGMGMGMGMVVTVCLFLMLGFNNIKYGLADIGTASSYQPPYTPTKCNGNRADQFPSGNLFASVSEGLWDNGAACGRRYRLKCLSGNNKPCIGGTIDVKVIDFCSKRPCPSTIVLSSDAFSAISKSQKGKINIEYVQI
ncbi:EG45-like domain containing protein [Cynara cardunculus var. scolymus]|uniref:Barwin-like endoglucanase n=1 Tax=Cynara cardunculus var. scolymus TaxID=59895 RepID=A0A103XZL4_CYNCS|nr:EG45-like domain containing protein [Cynara cardunculus var. scolymus]KVH99794.1 Barwin-like endoglucanase [Cynara cardunculus var. scolymus]